MWVRLVLNFVNAMRNKNEMPWPLSSDRTPGQVLVMFFREEIRDDELFGYWWSRCQHLDVPSAAPRLIRLKTEEKGLTPEDASKTLLAQITASIKEELRKFEQEELILSSEQQPADEQRKLYRHQIADRMQRFMFTPVRFRDRKPKLKNANDFISGIRASLAEAERLRTQCSGIRDQYEESFPQQGDQRSTQPQPLSGTAMSMAAGLTVNSTARVPHAPPMVSTPEIKGHGTAATSNNPTSNSGNATCITDGAAACAGPTAPNQGAGST